MEGLVWNRNTEGGEWELGCKIIITRLGEKHIRLGNMRNGEGGNFVKLFASFDI